MELSKVLYGTNVTTWEGRGKKYIYKSLQPKIKKLNRAFFQRGREEERYFQTYMHMGKEKNIQRRPFFVGQEGRRKTFQNYLQMGKEYTYIEP